MAVTQPFLPSIPGLVLLLLLILVLVIPLWRSAANLQEHVRAGAHIVLERLAAESRDGAPISNTEVQVTDNLLPGIGAATPFRLPEHSSAVGHTLKQLELRGKTGAAVVAIDRGAKGLIFPTGDEKLERGDLLVLTGSGEAVRAALELLSDSGSR